MEGILMEGVGAFEMASWYRYPPSPGRLVRGGADGKDDGH